jgi:hypothetical protein
MNPETAIRIAAATAADLGVELRAVTFSVRDRQIRSVTAYFHLGEQVASHEVDWRTWQDHPEILRIAFGEEISRMLRRFG